MLVLFLLLLMLIPCAQTQNGIAVDVERDIKVAKGGLVYINDSIRVTASAGSAQLRDLTIGFHESYSDVHRSFKLGDSQELAYEVVGMGEEFSGYRLKTPELTLSTNESVVIRATYLFVDTVYQFGNYSARLPLYPGLYRNISSISVDIQLPEGSELLSISSDKEFMNHTSEEQVKLIHHSEDISELTSSDVIVEYTPPENDLPLIDCEYLEGGINVFPGRLEMEDTYIIINRGNAFSEFNVSLPSEASNIRARDSVGPLDVDDNCTEESGVIGIEPRSVVYQGYRWEFTVKYEMSYERYINTVEGSKALEYTTPSFHYYIKDHRVRVTLPKGGTVENLPTNASFHKEGGLTDIIYNLGNTLPEKRHRIILRFDLNPLTMYSGPLAAITVIAAAFVGIYLIKYKKLPIERPVKRVPQKAVVEEKKDLSELVDLYEQRLNLLKEMEKVERSVSSGSIDPTAYDSRMARLRNETKRILGEIEEEEEEILEREPSLEGKIGEIRGVERGLNNLDRDLNNLETRYRAGRIARRDFYNRRRSLTERRSEAIQRLENILEGLR